MKNAQSKAGKTGGAKAKTDSTGDYGRDFYLPDGKYSNMGIFCTNRELVELAHSACPNDTLYYGELDCVHVCKVLEDMSACIFRNATGKFSMESFAEQGKVSTMIRMTDRQMNCLLKATEFAIVGKPRHALSELVAAVDNNKEPERKLNYNEALAYSATIKFMVEKLKGCEEHTALSKWKAYMEKAMGWGTNSSVVGVISKTIPDRNFVALSLPGVYQAFMELSACLLGVQTDIGSWVEKQNQCVESPSTPRKQVKAMLEVVATAAIGDYMHALEMFVKAIETDELHELTQNEAQLYQQTCTVVMECMRQRYDEGFLTGMHPCEKY